MTKKTMVGFNSLYFGAVLFLLISSCKTSDTNNEDKKGFVEIFDGKTLQGWEGDPKHWKAEEGNLVGEVTPSTLLDRNTFIIWQGGEPGDFELKGEFRITKSGNSGINYRSIQLDDYQYGLKGYQADIDGKNNYTGQNYEERGRTTLAYRGEEVVVETSENPSSSLRNKIKNNAWTQRSVTGSLGNSASLGDHIKKEDWNEIHLIVNNNRLRHYVNGVLMSDVIDNDSGNRKFKGKLGVQLHVGPPMKVEYRNLRLKQL